LRLSSWYIRLLFLLLLR